MLPVYTTIEYAFDGRSRYSSGTFPVRQPAVVWSHPFTVIDMHRQRAGRSRTTWRIGHSSTTTCSKPWNICHWTSSTTASGKLEYAEFKMKCYRVTIIRNNKKNDRGPVDKCLHKPNIKGNKRKYWKKRRQKSATTITRTHNKQN